MGTSQALAGKPVQRWMVRDYLVRGAVTLATSQGGARLGLTVPDADNLGGLAPVVTGDPLDTTEASVTVELVNGGSLGSARWAWRSDSDDEWHGAHSDLYRWGVHSPMPTGRQGAVVVYSSVFRRIVLIAVDSGVVRVAYVAANARPESDADWSTASFTPQNGDYGLQHSLATCELRDGTLLLASRRTDGDFDFYRSTDGGLTWTLSVEAFLANQIALQGPSTVHTPSSLGDRYTPRMASSGDWVRLVLASTAGSLVTYVSSDSGASWSYSTTVLTAAVDIDDPLTVVQQNDAQPFALVAVDDSTGAFALVANPVSPGDTNKIHLFYATRAEGWVFQEDLFDSPTIDTTPRSYVAWTDPYWLYVWVYAADPGDPDDGWYTFRVPRDRVLDADSWQGTGQMNPTATTDNNQTHDKTYGATRLTPIQMNAVWAEDRAVMVGYLQDQEEGGAVTRKAARPWTCWVGGWSSRPWSTDVLITQGYSESLHWAADQGDPAGEDTSSADSGWTTVIAGAGTHSWSSQQYVEFSTTSGVATQRSYVQRASTSTALGGAPTWTNTSGYPWAAEFVAAVGLTAANSGSNISAGLYVEVPDTVGGGGYGWNLVVGLGTGSAVVYNGTTAIATITGLGLNSAESMRFHRLRLVVAPATSPSSPVGVLMHRHEDDDDWTESAPFNVGLSSSAGMTQHVTRFGVIAIGLSPSTTYLSRWREVRVSSGVGIGTDYTDWTAPDDLTGAFVAARARGLTAGSSASDPSRLRVSWGGAGGSAGDQWTHEVGFDYPASALGLDSPRIGWRSADGAVAGQRIVFDACGAGATVDDGSRWYHSAMALYGLEHLQTVITYSDDADGLVSAVSSTMTSVQYSGVRVVTARGRWLRLNTVSPGWRDGDLSGRLVKVTAAASATALGTIHKIERHVFDGSVHRVELATGGQFGVDALSAGDTLTVFSDRLWASYGASITPKRYMTLSFGGIGDSNWGGYWTCGSVVPGVERTWSPPLLWTHTDEQQHYSTVHRTLGGQSWAYRDAPAERTWTGRQQGAIAGERQAFRDALTYLSRSGEEPCALLLDADNSSDQDRAVLLTRYVGVVDLDNQAYYRSSGSTSQALAVGDLGIQFTELT